MRRRTLYEYQKTMGVMLKIKSVDVSPLSENITIPVVFKFFDITPEMNKKVATKK